MQDWLVYVLYALTVGVVVFLSIKLGKYVDVIDAKSKISGAFIGGVMLAAVTSLPELFTSLSAVWIVNESALVIGNILGSNLINLAFMGVIMLIFFRGFSKARFSKYYFVSLAVGIGMFGLTALGMFFSDYLGIGWYSAVSPIIFVLYVVFIYKMPKSEESSDSVGDSITLKQALIRFAICAVILIGASICLTVLTEQVAELLSLGETFAGALFLGVATSLPELISSITLCSRGNFDAAMGNLIGSDIFNFTILFVADIFSFGENSNIYTLNNESVWLLIFGVVAAVTAFAMLAVKSRKKQGVGCTIAAETLNAVQPALYVLFLLISTGIISAVLV